jgi:hypothetical protein
MLKKLLVAMALLLPLPALAQVQQSGSVTQKHVTCWTTSGVVQDCGSAASGFPSSFGVTNNGGPGICLDSAPITSPYNQLCFSVNTAAAAQITLQNFGGAAAQGLQFNVNGTILSLPATTGTQFITGNGPFTAGDIPCFLNSNGTLQDCGLNVSSGTINTGVWQGTAVAVGFGGTGASTAVGARGNLGLGTMATQNANAVAITGGTATGLPTPVNPTDVAIKSYVDSTASGLNVLPASRLASAAVLPNTPTYSNGASCVGATLTAGTNSTLTVDGAVANINDIVLVKNQASAFQNGVYTVTTAGSGGAAWVLTRATNFNTAALMKAGSYTFITAGTANSNTSWVLQAAVVTCGTDSLTWNQFNSTGAQVSSLGGATGAITLTTGQLAISGSTLVTAPGILTGILRSATTTDTILTTDCGGTAQEGTGSTGIFTVTLPSVSGFDSRCQIDVVNGDTGRGKILSGFPSTMTSSGMLWPGQKVRLSIVNGAWTATNPGRWKNPSTQTVHVDKTNGNNANDGLASGAGNAVQDAQHAWTNIAYLWDTQGTVPIIAIACGQTHTTQYGPGGTILGSNLVQMSPDGNCAASMSNALPCIDISDLSELDLNETFYGSSGVINLACNQNNAASSGNIYLHNAVVLDNEGTTNWTPAGNNDNFLFCDGPCEFTIANGMTQLGAGGGNYAINMSEGGKGTQSGTINASGSGGLTGVYNVFGGALLIIGTPTGSGWSSIGTSKIYGHGTVVTNGITPAGGFSVGASGVGCTSLTSNC